MMLVGVHKISLMLIALVAGERSVAPVKDHIQDYHELQEPVPNSIPWFNPSVHEVSEGGVLHDAVGNVNKAVDLLKDLSSNVADAIKVHEDNVKDAKFQMDKAQKLSDDLPDKVMAEVIGHNDLRMESMRKAMEGEFPDGPNLQMAARKLQTVARAAATLTATSPHGQQAEPAVPAAPRVLPDTAISVRHTGHGIKSRQEEEEAQTDAEDESQQPQDQQRVAAKKDVTTPKASKEEGEEAQTDAEDESQQPQAQQKVAAKKDVTTPKASKEDYAAHGSPQVHEDLHNDLGEEYQ